METSELLSICSREITNSLGYQGGTLSNERIKNLEAYLAQPYGNERPGRSKIVTTEVHDTIEQMLPYIVKTFLSTDTVGEFYATDPDFINDEKVVSDYILYVIMEDNPGYAHFISWFKDTLLSKVGIVKAWWDEQETTRLESYENLTQDGLDTLLGGAGDNEEIEQVKLEIVEQDQPDILDILAQVAPDLVTPPGLPPGAPLPGQEPPEPQQLFNVTIRRTNKFGRTRWAPLPPEEFLVNHRAVSLDLRDASFLCHRSKFTKTDLLQLRTSMYPKGIPQSVVDDLSQDDSPEFNIERQERFWPEDESPYSDRSDEPMLEVWLYEMYIKIDWDGDGKAEFRKILMAGEGEGQSVILDNEEVDNHPFVDLCAIPMPHKLYGLAVADIARPKQLLMSTVWRNIMDSAYQANNPRITYQKGTV